MRLLSAEEAKKLDKWAIEEMGIPIEALMECAGLNLVMAMEKEFGPLGERKISLVCGKGHNGGDGLVAARHLANQGCFIRVYLAGKKDDLARLTSRQLQTCVKMGLEVREILKPEDLAACLDEIQASDLLVDALLGTGSEGPLAPLEAKIADWMNATGLPIVSADLPTGVDATSGRVEGACVRASLTVTFGMLKRGLVIHPGAAMTGKLVKADIGIPSYIWDPVGCFLSQKEDLRHLALSRPRDIHKRRVGSCLVVAGSRRYSGAALLAARGCQRAGAGMTHLAVPGCLVDLAQEKLPEVIVHGLGDSSREFLEEKDAQAIQELASQAQSVVLGPGLGTQPGTQALCQALYDGLKTPLVADADALNALKPGQAKPPAGRILTPHFGEAARLAGVDSKEIEKDRLAWAEKLSRSLSAVVLLKGAASLTADPSGSVFVNSSGNPGLAAAGTGDVLSGVLGALLAQGLNPLDAARLGAYLHGSSADLLAAVKGEAGILAWEIAENIPNALVDLTKS